MSLLHVAFAHYQPEVGHDVHRICVLLSYAMYVSADSAVRRGHTLQPMANLMCSN